jgi:heme/copper-type cytochrome/quinol oxidase subunit 3
MKPLRVVADVSDLPRATFGHRSMMWWGTLGFIAIEGSTLFICVVSYFYLRRNFSTWPPEHVFRPALLIPTIQAGLMLVSNFPMASVDRAARRMDLRGVRTGMVICSVLAVIMTVLRWFEFKALNVRWDSNAYGSAAWATITSHGTLLLLETAETVAFTVLLFTGPVEERDLAGASDNALYWYFMSGVWIPLYVVIFLSPYLM